MLVRPSHKVGKKSTFLSHRAEMRYQFDDMKLEERSDMMVDTSNIMEEIRVILFRAVRMLERDTAFIRKCNKCGRISIIAKGTFFKMYKERQHNYFCGFCNADYWKKKWKQPLPDWYKKSKKISNKLQQHYIPIYQDYLNQLNKGVITSKL